MELSKFLKQLYRRKWMLILIPLISMVITFFLVRKLPSSFTAQAKIATGLVDETQHILSVGGITFQESQISQQFTNIIEMMKLKRMLDKVSYLMIIHDLTAQYPFSKPSKKLQALTAAQKKEALAIFRAKYDSSAMLNLWDSQQYQLYELLKSMNYDDKSLQSALTIYRVSNSDYLQVQYTSNNPEQSPFVVNNLCNEFITYYRDLLRQNKGKASTYLAAVLDQKYAAMNDKIALLKDYKIKNKILNLNEQSRILYSNMLLIDSRKQDAEMEIQAYTGALNSIDSKFDPKDRRYIESALTKLNSDILVTKSQMYSLSDEYVKSEGDVSYQKRMDTLKRRLDAQVNSLTDQYIYDPLNTKKDLMAQKLTLEVQRDIARNSIQGFSNQLNTFTDRFNRLVPFEAVIQSYERDIDVASREYLDILNKFNQTSMDNEAPVKLSLAQAAQPEAGAPNKKIFLVAIGGIAAFAVCFIVLFLLFFFDKSIASPSELVNKTHVPVLGHLAPVANGNLNLKELWSDTADSTNKALPKQKKLLRALRQEVMNELGAGKVICVTAFQPKSGASFVAINLAYALSMVRKRVLLIDGNFSNNTISEMIAPDMSISDLFTNYYHQSNEPGLVVAGSPGETRSPFEIASDQNIRQSFTQLPFDIILIDTQTLADEGSAKEWISRANKVVPVFKHNQVLSATDMLHLEWLKQTGKLTGWVYNNYDDKKKA